MKVPQSVASLGMPAPALVVWLRHVGWTFFGEPLAQLREIEEDFNAAGISVRFVVIGTPEEAAHFCGKFGNASLCLADPDKKTYKAMGLENFGLIGFLTNRDLTKRRDENGAAGFSQDWKATKLRNAAQLPGAAVIDARGEVRWIHRGRHPGDLPPMREMLAAAKAALG